MKGSALGTVAALLVCLAGCGSQNAESIPSGKGRRETETSRPPSTTTPSTTEDGTISVHGLSWDLPAGYEKQTPSGAMRAAQYRIPSNSEGVADGELVLFFFGVGSGGDVEQNLQRWAGQFKPADGSDLGLKAARNSFMTKSGLKVTTIQIAGHYQTTGMGSSPSYDMPGWSLYGAVVEGEGGPWFFMAVGPQAVIEAQHPSLQRMFEGLRPAP